MEESKQMLILEKSDNMFFFKKDPENSTLRK